MEFKLTINDKEKAFKHVVKEPEAAALVGLKIGDKVKGDSIGLPGYEFIITGGSDNAGFPMRRGIEGPERSKMLFTLKNGSKKRKTVMGNTVAETISQINMKVEKKGSKPLGEEVKAEEKKEVVVTEEDKAKAFAQSHSKKTITSSIKFLNN